MKQAQKSKAVKIIEKNRGERNMAESGRVGCPRASIRMVLLFLETIRT
jgi:hypothetical protein